MYSNFFFGAQKVVDSDLELATDTDGGVGVDNTCGKSVGRKQNCIGRTSDWGAQLRKSQPGYWVSWGKDWQLQGGLC